ncbi:MAG: HEAT repeat domain-containing protein [Planctomycetes bacterium]|nr:HEAT repeat domain-containing protein [Planctomycetota bacterium]
MRRLIVFLALFLFISAPVAQVLMAQDAEGDVQFKTLYRQGIDLVKRGKYQDAYVSFEKALQLSPSSDLVRFMIQETGDLIIKEMMSNPDLKQTALRILELGKGAFQRYVRSPEQIQAIVAQLEGSFDKKWEAINTLAAIGQRAAPFLIEQLGDKSDTKRTAMMMALEKIGNEAVLPMIEALQSKNMLVRQNAAIVLGVIRDDRALPELKRVYEDEKESPEVRRLVADALKKIARVEPDKLKPAKECYYELAEKYYYNHPSVMVNFYGEFIFWRWNKETDTLALREVPDFALNELLAEECCYDGLRLDDNYEPTWSLLVSVLLSKYNEADWALQAALKKSKTGEVADDLLKKLQADLAKFGENFTTGSIGGKSHLYSALKRSLSDGNNEVAVSCIKALAASADAKDLPTTARADASAPGMPLIEAIVHSDKRVRYAAAEALLKINPPESFPNMEKVIPVINEALGESGIRVVLMIEPDPEVRSGLKNELAKLNCFVTEALSAEEGIKMAKRFPTEDLIILNNKLANEVVFTVNLLVKGEKYSETVFNSLKDDIRSRGIPLIMIGGKEDLEKAKSIYQEKVDSYLVTPAEGAVLAEAINKVFQREEIQNDSKSKALQVCADAAKGLSRLDMRNTIYPYRQTIEALLGVLEGRPDNIRELALEALRRFADAAALDGLLKVLTNKENPLLIRQKTGEVIAAVFRGNPDSISQEIYDTLKKSFKEDEPEIKLAVAMALGNAKLTPTQRKELFELNRPVLPGE